MNVNVDEEIKHLLPWELTMTIGGRTFRTARPTMGMIARLQTMQSLGTDDALQLVDRIFNAPGSDPPGVRPEPLDFSPEQMTLVVFAYLEHFAEHVRKNCQAVAGRKRTATAPPTQAQTAAPLQAAMHPPV